MRQFELQVQYSTHITRRNKYLLLLAVWDREALDVSTDSTEMKLLVQTTACYCGCAPLGRYLKNCLCPFLRWQGMVKSWWSHQKRYVEATDGIAQFPLETMQVGQTQYWLGSFNTP